MAPDANDPLANPKAYEDYSNRNPNDSKPALDADLARSNYNRNPSDGVYKDTGNDLTDRNRTGLTPTADVSPETARQTGNVPINDPAALKANREAAAKTRRDNFELEQKSRAEAFERDQNAREQALERQESEDAANAEKAAAIAKARADNDEAALNAGLITHDDLLNRPAMLASYQGQGVLLPHEAVGPDEDTVKMAFPRNVVLTHSAADVKRLDPDKPTIDSPIQHGSRILFYKGYHDVPVTLADHQYLADSGAYRLGADGKPETRDAYNDRVKKTRDDRKASRKEARKAEDREEVARVRTGNNVAD